MPRPRKPDDPYRRQELPCDRCGGGYYLVVNWGVEDQICGYCYQQAKRTRGTCACGHVGILPGRVNGQPSCRTCAGISLNIDCVACGVEDELYSAGRCWSCTLGDTVNRLLTHPETNSVPEQLLPLATALKSMKRANSGLTWIRQPHVAEFLHNLAIRPEISHQGIDALPHTRTREYIRGLLVEHDVLPRRDELKIRYQQWAAQALERVADQRMRDVIERYIRWHHLRRMNQMDTVPNGTFLRSKQTVTVAINFVNWTHTRGLTLEELRQADIDEWVNGGPSTRLLADRFIGWAITNRLVPAGLTIPRHRRGTSAKLDAASQEAALTKVLDGSVLSPRDRAVASLVLVFGQQIEAVVALTWDDLSIHTDNVAITLGGCAIELREPLDAPWRHLLEHPGSRTAAHPNNRWVFPGYSPGQHINAASLRERLRAQLISARAARLGTLHELTKLAPAAIIADALGYTPATIERHAKASGAQYAQYIAAILDSSRPTHGQG